MQIACRTAACLQPCSPQQQRRIMMSLRSVVWRCAGCDFKSESQCSLEYLHEVEARNRRRPPYCTPECAARARARADAAVAAAAAEALLARQEADTRARQAAAARSEAAAAVAAQARACCCPLMLLAAHSLALAGRRNDEGCRRSRSGGQGWRRRYHCHFHRCGVVDPCSAPGSHSHTRARPRAHTVGRSSCGSSPHWPRRDAG